MHTSEKREGRHANARHNSAKKPSDRSQARRSPAPSPRKAPSKAMSPREAAARSRQIAEAVNTTMQGRMVQVGTRAEAGASGISSGFPALDAATGLGGFPRGRITEIIGRPTSGRGTIATRAVAASAGHCAWVDIGGAIDIDYLMRAGTDLDRLFVIRPRAPEDALGIAAHLMSCGQFHIVVVDALVDLAQQSSGGRVGPALSRFLRVVTPKLARSPCAALILSGPEHHYQSLAHAAALRISLTQVGLLRKGGVLRGWRTRATILKSPGLQGGEPGIEVWL